MKTKLIIGGLAVIAGLVVIAALVLPKLSARRAESFDEDYLAEARKSGVSQKDAECMLGMVKTLALMQALDEHPEFLKCADPSYQGSDCTFAREWAESAERYTKSCEKPEVPAAPEGGPAAVPAPEQ
ncbi:MAG TPA: hypothetical protein VD862_00120 [Candidatus Paceibacterota bacterium]|nr:hypothetical protein [Candidatus Paceibacterota bacterium]